jgi:hypothetical protein
VEALDEHWPFEHLAAGRVSETIAHERDVPGLPGVNRSAPIHVVYLPRAARADPSLAIFPLSDAEALRDRFEGRDRPEDDPRALDRHAQHLAIHGDWAALAWDREAVRHLGEGGITCADRGEDFAIAIDVPRMAEFAAIDAARPPWRAILEALGAEPGKVVAKVDPKTGARSLEFPTGRVGTVAHGWRTARLWAWKQRREVEVELEPADPTLRDLLAAALKAPRHATGAGVPAEALAWAFVHGAPERKALGRALHLLGVPSTDGLFADEDASTAAWALQAYAIANATEGHSWTVVLESLGGPMPRLAPALRALPPLEGSLPLAPGAAPITVSDTRWPGPSPAGTVLHPRVDRPGGLHESHAGQHERLILGMDAERVATRVGSDVAGWRAPMDWPDPANLRELARFGISAQRVFDVLGKLPAPGGLLSVLSGGGIEGDLATDGRILRLRLRVAPR